METFDICHSASHYYDKEQSEHGTSLKSFH